MKKFLKKFKQTFKIENTLKGEDFIKDFEFAKPLIENYGGVTFNNGLFRIHTKASANQWTTLLTQQYFKKEMEGENLFCFGFNWQGCMYCINSSNDKIIYFDPATCEYFSAEDISLTEFLDDILTDNEYDIISEEYFEEAFEDLGKPELSFHKSYGHKQYLHLGGEDDTTNLEIVNTEVLWDLQIQLAESINELP